MLALARRSAKNLDFLVEQVEALAESHLRLAEASS